MFIPTKSDGQVFMNLRKKISKNKKKKKKTKLTSLHPEEIMNKLFDLFLFLFFFFFKWDPHVPFSLFLDPFQPETIYFVPVSISFILIEYSLYICNFLEFFKNPVFRFHSIPVA